MFCTQCGKKISMDDRFCSGCGAPNKNFQKEINVAVKPEEPKPEKAKSEEAKPEKKIYHAEAFPKEKEEVILESEQYDYRALPGKEVKGIKSIYMIDFFSRLTGKSNIPMCIYLILNVGIIGLICSAFLALPIGWGMAAGLILYIASVTVALSPIGEFMIRYQNNCREIRDVEVVNRLEPLFREVYYKAKKQNPEISGDVRLFMNEDKSPNAFATGRKTICITRGMLEQDDDTIKATFAHEFGHLAHKDTDRLLVVYVGNLFITAIASLFQIAVMINYVIMSIVALFMDSDEGFFVAIFNAIASFISLIFVRGLMRVWGALGTALCMKTSRGNEYEADHFAFTLGYGRELTLFLTALAAYEGDKPRGLFASLASSHPDSKDRVDRLLELEAQAL